MISCCQHGQRAKILGNFGPERRVKLHTAVHYAGIEIAFCWKIKTKEV